MPYRLVITKVWSSLLPSSSGEAKIHILGFGAEDLFAKSWYMDRIIGQATKWAVFQQQQSCKQYYRM